MHTTRRHFMRQFGASVLGALQAHARWAQAVQPIMVEYVAAMKAKNLPGEEVLNFCIEWLKKNP